MEHRERKSDMMTCSCVRRPVRSISVAVSENQNFVRKWSQMSIKFAIFANPPNHRQIVKKGGQGQKIFVLVQHLLHQPAYRCRMGATWIFLSDRGSTKNIKERKGMKEVWYLRFIVILVWIRFVQDSARAKGRGRQHRNLYTVTQREGKNKVRNYSRHRKSKRGDDKSMELKSNTIVVSWNR